ncbi:MAG: hypothetical protein D6808_04875 [Candidatus Dadabacteria bacterium]|nr:MAG: hypothetical protein D6808_04875 [Candidatus Dadabacteria bacterium]
MIRINLVWEDDAGGANKIFQVAAFLLSLLSLFLAFYLASNSLAYKTKLYEAEKKIFSEQISSLRKVTKEVRDLEKKRDILKNKIEVIATLRKQKTGPVRILDDLNQALPSKSWLTGVSERGGVMSIVGLALDNQTIADFMKELEKSNFFLQVDLLEARQVSWNRVKMKKFTLSAVVDYAGGEHKKEEDAL